MPRPRKRKNTGFDTQPVKSVYSIDRKDKAHTMMEQNIRLCEAVAQYCKLLGN